MRSSSDWRDRRYVPLQKCVLLLRNMACYLQDMRQLYSTRSACLSRSPTDLKCWDIKRVEGREKILHQLLDHHLDNVFVWSASPNTRHSRHGGAGYRGVSIELSLFSDSDQPFSDEPFFDDRRPGIAVACRTDGMRIKILMHAGVTSLCHLFPSPPTCIPATCFHALSRSELSWLVSPMRSQHVPWLQAPDSQQGQL